MSSSAAGNPASGLRFALHLLPAVHLLAGIALLVAAIGAWGVADPVGYPAWGPTAGGMIVVVPILIFETLVALTIWRRTSGAYIVERRRIWLGVVCFALLIAIALAYTATINDFATYKGDFDDFKQRYNPIFELSAFLTLNAMIALVVPSAMLAGGIKVFYLDAIQPARGGVVGPDPIGEIMRTSATR